MSGNGIRINDGAVELRVNPDIYSKETVFAAGYIFLDKAYVLVDRDKDAIIVCLYPQHKDADLKKIGLDFYNELLNYAHYFSRAKANAEAVKNIMQRALFSASPSLLREAEDKEIEDLIKELDEEEKNEEKRSSRARINKEAKK